MEQQSNSLKKKVNKKSKQLQARLTIDLKCYNLSYTGDNKEVAQTARFALSTLSLTFILVLLLLICAVVKVLS